MELVKDRQNWCLPLPNLSHVCALPHLILINAMHVRLNKFLFPFSPVLGNTIICIQDPAR